MSSYTVELSRTAGKYYKRVDVNTAQRLDECFKMLEENPFDFEHCDIKKLWGQFKGRLRYRIGSLRVIYRVDKEQKVVYIEVISSRGDLY